MTSKLHPYGPSCKLHSASNTFIRRASELAESVPKLKPHFFYCSTLPIDDPLSPLPAPSTNSLTTTSRITPRPFSAYDNAALEEAWQGLQRPDKQQGQTSSWLDHGQSGLKHQTQGKSPVVVGKESSELSRTKEDGSEYGSLTQSLNRAEAKDKSPLSTILAGSAVHGDRDDEPFTEYPGGLQAVPKDIQCDSVVDPVQAAENTNQTAKSIVMLSEDPEHLRLVDPRPMTSEEVASQQVNSMPGRGRHNLFHRKDTYRSDNAVGTISKPSTKDRVKEKVRHARSLSRNRIKPVGASYGSSPSERDTTGTPFLRAPSRDGGSQISSRNALVDQSDEGKLRGEMPEKEENLASARPGSRRMWSDRSDSIQDDSANHHDGSPRVKTPQQDDALYDQKHTSYVPVGLSRLHLVEMPQLVMKPIYWSPVHDISSVVRGTWFYKDTMLPVESDVANRLEEGYEYMKPWSQTYADEVTSCLNIGPEAESKVVHRLWPSDEPKDLPKRQSTSRSWKPVSQTMPEPLTSDEQARKDASDVAASAENRAAGTLDGIEHVGHSSKLYAKSSVIYANAKDAQILKANQLPSAARGRKPLGPIRKGRHIGIPVVRGFDYRAYTRLYPPKKSAAARRAHAGATASRSGIAMTAGERDICPACLEEEERSAVTDLILVIHGIGQKLSERVESYHFTHAINSFRRQVNVELEADVIQPWLREDLGGIMVLPVNWRSTLNFEDGDPGLNIKATEKDRSNQYTLKDITAESIPAVRSLISDVLLDIPYYLSSHKSKMIEAVIKEANRIYRLWCGNNPGFHETGRVHLIAHSLGSVMALDILSKQPTRLPKHLDLEAKKVHGNMFEFDTKNLFFCGSPAGFFLLLNHAPMIPRKGRGKPGTEGEDFTSRVAGEAGTYGCLAVDNIYNVMHTNDPIAYRINACVDVNYSASIQSAFVPSATSSWIQSIGYVIRGKPTVPARGSATLDTGSTRPAPVKLPSTIEMETHNFTQEEIAEKKMYLLNDNGQIDYFLSSGGGPLEIQYLNMLGAHSSYWVLQDFVRFLVVEVGRKAGRSETLQAMRATKKAWSKK